MEAETFVKGDLVIKGKTKAVWEIVDDPYHVLIENFDDMTKGDGADRVTIANKGALSTRTTSNVFQALNDARMYTHFCGQYNATTFYALKVKMFPLEVVARRKAYGSYLKRNTDTPENFVFENVMIEFFYKWDEKNDPYVLYNPETEWYDMYDAKKPVSEATYMGEVPRDRFMPTYDQLMLITAMQIQAFELLEEKWKGKQVELVDMKCEYGETLSGEVVLADVIDNDSWRIRYRPDMQIAGPGIEMSKQVYRDMKEKDIDEEKMGLLTKNLVWVANQTDSFPTSSVCC
jgi:phosphoribosylaminoimidazole-succinocarboxamide synthase